MPRVNLLVPTIFRVHPQDPSPVVFLFEDRFNTQQAPPMAGTRITEPGGQNITIVDSANKYSINSSGKMVSPTHTAAGDPSSRSDSFARAIGRAGFMKMKQTSDRGSFGWTNSATPNAQAFAGYAVNGGAVVPHHPTQPIRHTRIASTVETQFVAMMRNPGGSLFRFDGTNWVCDWTDDIGTTTPLYWGSWTAGLTAYNVELDDWLITDLPAPANQQYGLYTYNSTSVTSGVTVDGGAANALWQLQYALPGSPVDGNFIELYYHYVDASNHDVIRIIRESGVWNLYHHAVVAGTPTSLLTSAASNAPNIGTTTLIFAQSDGSVHHSWTANGSVAPVIRTPVATFSAEGGTTNSNHVTNANVRVAWSGSFTITRLCVHPKRSTAIDTVLNRFFTAGSPPPPPDDDLDINLVWFYKPETDDRDDEVAALFTTFILTKGDEANRDLLKFTYGNLGPYQEYIRADGVHDPCNVANGGGDCGSTHFQNNVNDFPHSTYNLIQAHPEYFIHDDDDGGIHRSGDGYAYTNFGAAGWHEYWVEKAIVMHNANGWDGGWFLDNVPGTLNHVGEAIEEYTVDSVYRTAVLSYLAYLWNNRPGNIKVYANLIYTPSGATGTTWWDDALDYLDGAMEEGAFITYTSSNTYLSVSEWNTQMTRFENAIARQKLVIAIAQGFEDLGVPLNLARFRFAFASYLLLAGPYICFRWTNFNNYNEIWLADDYNLNIGAPTGARVNVSGNLWRRDFDNGYVEVDSNSHAVTLSFS